ncbi:hypothetical protein LXL04_016506 [Taraxacum kok-saghyz]
MVGSANWVSKSGKPLKLDAVLKLNFTSVNISLNNRLVSGMLESLTSVHDSDYFEPITMIGFPRVDHSKYTYSLVSNEECKGPNGDFRKEVSVCSMQSLDLCSIFTNQFHTYKLEFKSSGFSPSFPAFLSLYAIQCSLEEKKLRLLVELQDRRYTHPDQSFNPNISFIGDGTWNGQIWSTKKAADDGYFEAVKFQSFDHSIENYGSKYEFTKIEKVRQICPSTKYLKKEAVEYPSGYNNGDMTLDMSVMYGNVYGVGSAVPIFGLGSNVSPMNISYEFIIRMFFNSTSKSMIPVPSLLSTDNSRLEISAEGFYDRETGGLCMIGCRNLPSFGKNLNFDCEILVRLRINLDPGSFFINGSIQSLREKTDKLYFESLNVVPLGYTETEAMETIWRMDLELIMDLISGTLSCFFIVVQLFHVKKNPEMIPLISVLMMVILALGESGSDFVETGSDLVETGNSQTGDPLDPFDPDQVILWKQEVIWWKQATAKQETANGQQVNGEVMDAWLEVIVNVVTMAAFILQFRLLRLAWNSKNGDDDNIGNGKSNWNHEIWTLIVCLPNYIVGGWIMLLVNWMNYFHITLSKGSIWDDLRCYGGLTLEGFLFPQIVLNIFQISKGNALSRFFYVGNTFVRLLPHVYDLYRDQKNVKHQFGRFYLYANPRADFYSPYWNVFIVFGGVVFAVIMFLQQHFGGRFILQKRF